MRPEPTHVILEKLYNHINIAFSKEVIEDVDAHARIIEGNIIRAIIKLENYIWAEKLVDHSVSHSHYKSWWDHFKDDKMPKWFIKRFPIKSTTITHHFAQYAKFPKFKWFSDREKEEFVIQETMEVIRDEI